MLSPRSQADQTVIQQHHQVHQQYHQVPQQFFIFQHQASSPSSTHCLVSLYNRHMAKYSHNNRTTTTPPRTLRSIVTARTLFRLVVRSSLMGIINDNCRQTVTIHRLLFQPMWLSSSHWDLATVSPRIQAPLASSSSSNNNHSHSHMLHSYNLYNLFRLSEVHSC
ncbi:uncharacterized protein CYBJADRAFT_70251 [Cyberlindnera jadinii NRRL Y-1542]|uniref:Uncharacterized protein n=1 Tax=Cyberlindnera jadinii (strain ATCC 18201 / CBS 1600 / BCRC 20928 / JCM 3617 / NBRC 0987 / NRRL Y-1542) TaxID=983966 RepID=A0A1E4S3V7_CYBJN|nr:hypothetical protein CYBJADRAFT_70251 [Cyberlindnera jadinii NRRL Y-1542]ODV74181.1 hypothetical protein CYBJADRAFT_70251 [Cyberlindnera jadinii NRRL Y-1542]